MNKQTLFLWTSCAVLLLLCQVTARSKSKSSGSTQNFSRRLAVGPTVLITGANRGLGLGLLVQLLEVPGVKHIFAGTRNVYIDQFQLDVQNMIDEVSQITGTHNASRLKDIVETTNIGTKYRLKYTNVNNKTVIIELVQIDIADDNSIEQAFHHVQHSLHELAERWGRQTRLDLLINNAGFMKSANEDEDNTQLGMDPINPSREVFMEHFNVNAAGSLMTTSKFLPLLRNYQEQNSDRKKAGVIFISSTTSSISMYMGRRSHNNEAYPASKAALNHIMKSYADPGYTGNDLISLAICPGWVATDMGLSVPADRAYITSIPVATYNLIQRILLFTDSDSGNFYSPLSQPIPFGAPYPF